MRNPQPEFRPSATGEKFCKTFSSEEIFLSLTSIRSFYALVDEVKVFITVGVGFQERCIVLRRQLVQYMIVVIGVPMVLRVSIGDYKRYSSYRKEMFKKFHIVLFMSHSVPHA